MDIDLLRRLVAMPYNEAHNYLNRLNLPPTMRKALQETADKQRRVLGKARKRSKLANRHHAEQWHRLIAPLKYELSNAKVGMRLKSFDDAPERHEAFAEYVLLMEKLLSGLQHLQQNEEAKLSVNTYSDIQAQLDAEEKVTVETALSPTDIALKKKYPNKGEHWTDWIGATTKARIEKLFDSVPYVAKTKRFVPFQRRVPESIATKQREELQKRTLSAIELVEQELELVRESIGEQELKQNDERLKTLDTLEHEREQMYQVLYAVTYEFKKTRPLPPTWHGLAGKVCTDKTADEISAIGVIRHLRHKLKWETHVATNKHKAKRPAHYKV